MRRVLAPIVASLLAAFFAGTASSSCATGETGRGDGGPDGGPARECKPRGAPASSPNAPRRFLTPAAVPLPTGRAFGSSPLAARGGNATVASFPVENGVGVATGASSPFSGALLLGDRVDTPALATVGNRFFLGYRAGGILTVGVAEDAQGVIQLASGRGRTLQIALPAGATTPANLVLGASPNGAPAPSVLAAFTAIATGGQTRVFVARLQNAACASCTLAFEAPVEASPNVAGATLPQIAINRTGGATVSFVRGMAHGTAQVWVSQAQMGSAPLSFRPLLIAEDAALVPSPVAYYADGSLALVHGRLAVVPPPDGTGAAPQVADVVARRLSTGTIGPAVRVHDDDPALGATHWLPGASVDGYDRLWVAWYDTRFGEPGDDAWGPGPGQPARDGSCTAVVMLARSDDRGATFKPNALVTPDALAVPFDPVPQSSQRTRSPLGPVTVLATDVELIVGYTDATRPMLAQASLP